jgi:hypothetical protein
MSAKPAEWNKWLREPTSREKEISPILDEAVAGLHLRLIES